MKPEDDKPPSSDEDVIFVDSEGVISHMTQADDNGNRQEIESVNPDGPWVPKE